MKDIFKQAKEKILENENRQREEQQNRENRLEELKSAKEKRKGHLSNPIKSFRMSKEIKELQKEIGDYKEKKKNIKMLLFGIPAVLAAFLLLWIAFPDTDSEEAEAPLNPPVVMSELETAPTLKPESVVPDKNASSSSEFVSELEEDPAGEQSHVESVVPSIEEGRLTADDLSVSITTDYGHIRGENTRLGHKEGATIAIRSASENFTKEDIVVICDENILNTQTKEGDDTVQIYVTGKSAGVSDVIIVTADDLELYGEEAHGYVFQIQQLDASDGRIVYTTPTGEKYHISKDCAGDSAVPTTIRDAVDAGYGPCGKCAK